MHSHTDRYKRALNAVKLDRMFAKPFVGSLEGHADGSQFDWLVVMLDDQLTCRCVFLYSSSKETHNTRFRRM